MNLETVWEWREFFQPIQPRIDGIFPRGARAGGPAIEKFRYFRLAGGAKRKKLAFRKHQNLRFIGGAVFCRSSSFDCFGCVFSLIPVGGELMGAGVTGGENICGALMFFFAPVVGEPANV